MLCKSLQVAQFRLGPAEPLHHIRPHESHDHGDHHDHWINPDNNQNMINANDGGATITARSIQAH